MTSPDTEASGTTPAAPRRRVWLALLPLAVFGALVVLFWVGLFSGDKSRIPSALIGKPVPTFTLAPLEGLTGADGQPMPGFASADLRGQVSVVNVWASWCGPCRDEHPQLVELAKDNRFRLIGLNYKDTPENARRFLGRFGNPYVAVGVDPSGRTGIDWGVYGVPETFVVGRDGTILYKFIGPILPDGLPRIRAEIDKALTAR